MSELCPKCLAELPAGYAFDHVAIDYALVGNIAVLRGMPMAERQELVLEARRRGLADTAIADLLHRNLKEIREWAEGREVRRPGCPQQIDDDAVRRLWQQGLCDADIGARLGVGKSTVGTSRRRQGLPALFRGGARVVIAA